MIRKLLVLAFGATLGIAGVQAANAAPAAHGIPAIRGQIMTVGHRHHRGYVARGYDRGYDGARPRYRGRDHYRPRHGHQRGYYPGYPGQYPAYGRGNAYSRGHGHSAWQQYLRNRYGK